jgi:hypothetical protein
MSRMIDLIRQSAVPANIVRSAARGALSLPTAEMLEILVELSSRQPFAEQAQLTLAGWDQASARNVLADPQTPAAVLDYFSSAMNIRMPLLPVLLENPSVTQTRLAELAASHSAEVLSAMLQSARICQSVDLLTLLAHNPHLPRELAAPAQQALAALGGTISTESPDLLDIDIPQYLTEHQEEIRAAENEPFCLVDSPPEEQTAATTNISRENAAAAAAKAMGAAEQDRLSPVQKIAKMNVGERVMLALKGSREERSILIRDGARVVSNAVLESPKLNEQEVESYAGLRNVAESVLRAIASKRKWIRHYAIVRALARNPRTPIDVSVPLIKGMLMLDLKGLTANKEIPDTVRNIAYKLFRERLEERSK